MHSSFTSRRPLLAITSKYRNRDQGKAFFQLFLSLILWITCYFSGLFFVEKNLALSLISIASTSLFTVRLFMLQHDCGHRSLFSGRRTNEVVGVFISFITMTPFYAWARCHANHHANSGLLEYRGIGDIRTLTVREFLALSPFRRFAYRLYRNPLVLFFIGPFVVFCLRQRFAYYLPPGWRKERISVYLTNLMLILMAVICIRFSEKSSFIFLIYHLGMMAIAASAGVWLFYIQHQFESTYWSREEDYDGLRAALQGSSFYALPRWLHWLTANIGYHHIHHLDSQIPFYRLAQCFSENPQFREVAHISLLESLYCVGLKLWDEDKMRLVPFPPIKTKRG